MTRSRLDQIRKNRLEKRERLIERGIDPYPARAVSGRLSAQVKKELGKKVRVRGRLTSWRPHGKITFADLTDDSGKIQLYFQKDTLGKKYDLLKFLDVGDFLSARGRVFKTKAGEVTVDVSSFSLQAKSIRPLPGKWHGLKDVEIRYRRRYLDLLSSPEVKGVFRTRAEILTSLRQFLDRHGFLEVETPVLQPIYGGASARPFITHHNALGHDFYLRISDELYLKRLIVGGFEKVYEVSRDFRNEGIDRQHNPEFTQIEFYWAWVDYEELMRFTQKMLAWLIKKIKGDLTVTYQGRRFDFTPPWRRVSFTQALLEETEIDITETRTESQLKREIRKKGLSVDLSKAVGLGAIYDQLYKTLVRPKLTGPLFLVDYPAEMIALAKRKDGDPNRIASFQLLVDGMEMTKAYNELNDPVDQKERWLEEEKRAKRGVEETERLDEDYIGALEYGMPPTAGWGMGIDRLTMFLTDQPTLKDVILFPTLKPKEQLATSNK